MRVSPALRSLSIGLSIGLLLSTLFSSCSLFHRKSASYSRMIPEGESNPTIREAPERAGEVIRYSNQPRHQFQ